MREVSLEELLEAGCHFGHQVTRSNPKARDFIFESRDNINIIDLAKTKEGLEDAAKFVKETAKNGGTLLVVATKRQATSLVLDEIQRVKEEFKKDHKDENDGLFYISERWVGGILTNIQEVSKNFKKLEDIEKILNSDEEKDKYTKKELGLWDKERGRLDNLYKGIRTMSKKPDVVFIIDSHLEHLAVKESLNVGVPSVAIVDTNSDPTVIDYPIPANDDAVGSIKLISGYIMDAWLEGKKAQKTQPEPKEGAVKPKAEVKAKKEDNGKSKPKSAKKA